MAKIQVSAGCYNELSQAIKRTGREINDGAPLTVEKGEAIFPPYDFRMVVVRQNCLMSAAEVFKNSALDTSEEFLNIAQNIFNWCLNGEDVDKGLTIATNETPAKEWK